jgi:hypothetical protein
MKKTPSDGEDTVSNLLRVVTDLLRGTRHSRHTLAKLTGKSLRTADLWFDHIAAVLPGIRRVHDGTTTWLIRDNLRHVPSHAAAVGACLAGSLRSIFEGSKYERSVKDARDYILGERGDVYTDLDRKFVMHRRVDEYVLPKGTASLDEIIEALLSNSRMRFSYTDNDGRAQTTVIEPLSLVIFDQQFYMIVRRENGTYFPYRLATMNNLERLAEIFTYPSESEYSPAAILALATASPRRAPGQARKSRSSSLGDGRAI